MNKDILTKERILRLLDGNTDVAVFKTVDSTNNEAKRFVKNGNTRETLFVAGTQTAGRGRQGRSFYSPEGTGIYMTLLLFTENEERTGVTAAAAVAVCRAVEALSGKSPQIKWVNDVYIDGKKVCGILCESIKSPQGKTALIIGIGVNINTADFPDSVENGGSIGCIIDRAYLAAAITNELYKTVFFGSGYIEEYRKRSMLTGRNISFIRNGEKRTAAVLGIDDCFGLRVMLENGEKQTLVSGEVSVRPE